MIADFNSIKKQASELLSRLFQQNKFEKTLKDYLAMAAANPDDVRLKQKIAETYFKARDLPKAIEVYRDIANTYSEQNFILKAVAAFKTVLKLDPTQVEINIKLAELYMKLEMIPEGVNQYRIALQSPSLRGDKETQISICQKLVEIDPSPSNRRGLAETYQLHGMTKEALDQYEILAQAYRMGKQYDDLLRVYEIILAAKPSQPLIRDVCILYLRRQDPDSALRTIERHKVDTEGAFGELYDKAKMMQKALRGSKV